MLFLHDVWVNWFVGEEWGYNVYDFHEWHKDDQVEILDRIPLLKVSSALFHYIENSLSELPQSLLDAVYKKTYIEKDFRQIQLDYCFVVTDGSGILAVDTMGYKIPIRKSRLIPRQEQYVFHLVEDVPFDNYEFDNRVNKPKFSIYSPTPDCFVGLTRREKEYKKLMFIALGELKERGNLSELRYWYTEINPKNYNKTLHMAFDDLWDDLLELVKYKWDKNTEEVFKSMIRGKEHFEHMLKEIG